MSKRFNGVPREVLIQAILEVESEVEVGNLRIPKLFVVAGGSFNNKNQYNPLPVKGI